MLELLPSVPITQALFPLCIATSKCWIKKGNDLVSPVILLILWPSSFKKGKVSGANALDVSTATGWKSCNGSRLLYFSHFLFSTIAATTPVSLVALAAYEVAHNSLPYSHGAIVMPSGLFPSFLYIPEGSSRDQILLLTGHSE